MKITLTAKSMIMRLFPMAQTRLLFFFLINSKNAQVHPSVYSLTTHGHERTCYFQQCVFDYFFFLHVWHKCVLTPHLCTLPSFPISSLHLKRCGGEGGLSKSQKLDNLLKCQIFFFFRKSKYF